MDFDFWMLLAGIGIFLLGIHMMEESLKIISGKAFKNIIRKYTSTTFKSISTGTFSTAILQSSSAVSLMVLAFVGSGIMSLTNAIGVVLGSNLGTTLTSWIIATIGFKFKIEAFALPLVGIGGLGLIFLGKSQKWSNISKLLAGFGFIFMGLDYMKTSVEQFTTVFDLSTFNEYGILFYLLLGFVLTVVVQSSSASMAIILTAIFGGVIDFSTATAMVIGANMGTTVTIILGSIGGVVSKKQVAASHLIFNFATGIVALVLLYPLNYLILNVFGLKNELVIALALFHTLFNLIGVIIFAPFVKVLAQFITKFIKDKKIHYSKFVSNMIVDVPEAGIESVHKEALYIAHLSMVHNLKIFEMDVDLILNRQEMLDKNVYNKKAPHIYNTLKSIQSETFLFSSKLQKFEVNQDEAILLNRILYSIRNCLASCKSLKDIQHDLEKMDSSESQIVTDVFRDLRRKMLSTYQFFDHMMDLEKISHMDKEKIKVFILDINKDEKSFLQTLTASINTQNISESELSTLLTVIRNFSNSLRQMTLSVRELSLNTEEVNAIEELIPSRVE